MSNAFIKNPIEFEIYFTNKFSELSKGKYRTFPTSSKIKGTKNPRKFFEIYEVSEYDLWHDCRFHFEIDWEEGSFLSEIDKINIFIHVERIEDSKNPELTRKIRFEYSEKLNQKKTKNIFGEKFECPINFSSKDSTTQSIEKIINKLNSEEFQKVARRVKELSKEL